MKIPLFSMCVLCLRQYKATLLSTESFNIKILTIDKEKVMNNEG